MARWKRGEAEIEALIVAGNLQKLTGEAANGVRLLKKAAVTLETAKSAVERDPDSAFVLAYDASRQAVTALLATGDYVPPRRAATTPSNKLSGHSLVRASANSVHCDGRATSWSTRNDPATTPLSTRPQSPSNTRRRSSPRPRVSSTNSACSSQQAAQVAAQGSTAH